MTAATLTFAHGHREAYDQLTQAVRDNLPAHDGTIKVVEAGCGRAWTLGDLGARTHILGIDLDGEALRLRAEQQGDLDEILHGDLMEVRLNPSEYDLVFNSFVLEHLEKPADALDRFFKWLKPGGVVAVIIPDKDTAKGFATRLSPFFVHVWYYRWIKGRKTAGKPGYEPYRTFYGPEVSRKGLEQYCRQRGHDVVSEVAIAMTRDDEGTFTWLVSKAISAISFGKLRSDYCNLIVVMKKSAAAS
jgi:SAM-dependent methyltransferase